MLEDAEVPSIQEMYADSTKVLQLPFLYALEKPWERFPLVDGRFLYYGRQPFLEVYNRVNALDFNRSRMLFIHGALGVGKSYILAALACLLRKQKRRVVYMPDTRAMLRFPFRHMHSALLLAYADDAAATEVLRTECTSLSDLIAFAERSAATERAYYIIDQLNALDVQDPSKDRNDNEKKAEVRNFLDQLMTMHFRITSSSSNYLHGTQDFTKETGEERLSINQGLSEVNRYLHRYS